MIGNKAKTAVKQLVAKELVKRIEESLDDILRRSYYNVQIGTGLEVY